MLLIRHDLHSAAALRSTAMYIDKYRCQATASKFLFCITDPLSLSSEVFSAGTLRARVFNSNSTTNDQLHTISVIQFYCGQYITRHIFGTSLRPGEMFICYN